ncbi:hypothetical protein PR003_g7938 [Phytophthora rubi]|uniref:RxLR effector protein n=2 Tax=Phytophthora TaxID=4783 RepID=A0A6A3M200_9STRA|nr:hypothetical protein PR002_g21285 [Phytophthora rubi]KAE9026081.1 hypothetical protein PR001_g12273 [Phytophthora rubi]KAE9309032.1 hypothetical protein PF008_g20816 [Phytophthora fragariae]KAE9345465.1 hypothetical protein PR003_g7938 [Phytophthora rubi]
MRKYTVLGCVIVSISVIPCSSTRAASSILDSVLGKWMLPARTGCHLASCRWWYSTQPPLT